MIIGKGDIASVLIDKKGIIYFASGVSNSQEKRESEYQREIDLLLSQDKTKHLVYFSSLCVFYGKTRYANHKRYMERLIKKTFKKYTIMRIGNITWGKNPHTIINFIRTQIIRWQHIEVKDVYRYVVDKDEFLHWISLIPDWSCEMNITGKMMTVAGIVKAIKKGKL